jgi:hypothetical protein
MSSNFPGALDDSTSLPDPGAASYTNNPSHLGLHGNENAAIKALEAKVGIGASTPPGGGYIFTSSSNGTSSWQPAPAAGVWGLITGTLSNQTDLQTALSARLQLGGDISGTATAPIVLTSNGIAIVTTTGSQTLTNKSLTSPVMTGIPTAPTAAANNNSTQVATTAYVDALGSTTLVRNETPGGLVNSSNTAYTTAATFATGSLKVYLNGQRLAPGSGIDYVEVTQGFTMQYAPATGDVLLVDYETTNTTRFIQGSNSIIVQETPTGTVNGVTTAFTVLQAKYVANTLEVFINGLQQTKTTDYAETTPGSGIFTFVTAPVTGDVVKVSYQFATGASGNADTVDGFHASSTPTASNLLPLNSRAQSGEWWEEIGRTTLAVAGNSISVASLVGKKYLWVKIAVAATGGTVDVSIRFNNDSAASYSARTSTNGGADSTSVSQTNINLTGASAYTLSTFDGFITNVAAVEKNMLGMRGGNFSGAGAATAPDRAEIAGKWANTAAQITRVDILNLVGTGNFAIGSEVIILGHD